MAHSSFMMIAGARSGLVNWKVDLTVRLLLHIILVRELLVIAACRQADLSICINLAFTCFYTLAFFHHIARLAGILGLIVCNYWNTKVRRALKPVLIEGKILKFL